MRKKSFSTDRENRDNLLSVALKILDRNVFDEAMTLHVLRICYDCGVKFGELNGKYKLLENMRTVRGCKTSTCKHHRRTGNPRLPRVPRDL